MIKIEKLLQDRQILDESELESVVGGTVSDKVVRGLCQLAGSLLFSVSMYKGFQSIVNPRSSAVMRFIYGLDLCLLGIDTGCVVGGFVYDACKQICEEDSKESESSKKLEN